ncbi:M20/M25/M40 family metallo-hydrolase [Gramella sp. KN1008]|uniref:M28 family metallopeptidase n=1 Tax=Gramella sp. KN1008 TaxID=2529298 RepID=UPI00103BD96D|nr:M20/M25/M40 family metallo-hydrolase [Gramella sp. KN1008]TBW27394.1 M20/M25/M40 family metallo-hydrolase [Gramella sp. KN1008]
MRKKLHLPVLAGFFMMILSSLPVGAQRAQHPEIEISRNTIREAMEYLASDELAGRNTGSEEIDMAASFIEGKFNEFGLKPYFKTYRDSFAIGELQAYNIVGVAEGIDEELKDEFIIIGAHYDHVGKIKSVNGDEIANGANDNASGTVGVMELAKYFGVLRENKRSVMFVLFSGEEKGLRGSKHLAAKLKKDGIDLYAMVNLEMIGVPMKDKDYLAYVTGYENSNLAKKFNEYSYEENVLGFFPQAKQLNLFKRSDNYPFYQEFKVPAQTICTFDFSNYPYYHHVDDEVGLMDYEHMANLVENLLPGLMKMSTTEIKEIKLTE